ncbi:hypothetical protein V7S43_013442 [Phytophthora oleae]|uniref:RxLR effector protein n=1 Tax=Phytophthora oleae TaxID=2107226 RepID=A0ABD3F4D2_9STRA
MRIKAAVFSDLPPERTKDYQGRIRTWPGLLLMMLVVGGALALITQQAMKENDSMRINVVRYEHHIEKNRKIEDGKEDDQVIISDDRQVGNPKKYPDMGCELPDYQSKTARSSLWPRTARKFP